MPSSKIRGLFEDSALDNLEYSLSKFSIDINYESGFESYLKLGLTSKKLLRDLEAKSKSLSAKEDTSARSPATAVSGTSGAKHNTVHLPKLKLPIFSGETFKFREFFKIFEASVGSSTLSSVEKFVYLREHLKDTAKECIAGLDLCSANYDVAINIL